MLNLKQHRKFVSSLSVSWLLAVMLAMPGCWSATTIVEESGDSSSTEVPAPSLGEEAEFGAEEGTEGDPVTPANTPDAGASDAAPEARPADEVTLTPVTPEEFEKRITSKRGKVLLVDFWATWCVPCRQNFPHIVEFSEKYGDNGLEVISVSLDDQEARDAALEFLKENDATFENYISTLGLDSFEAFGIASGSIPHYRLYNRQGKLHTTFESDPTSDEPISAEAIEAGIQELLQSR